MRNTQVVRNVMNTISPGCSKFTNKYKNCRTVKCYGGINKFDAIRADLNKTGISFSAKIKAREYAGNGNMNFSIIVRLPLGF